MYKSLPLKSFPNTQLKSSVIQRFPRILRWGFLLSVFLMPIDSISGIFSTTLGSISKYFFFLLILLVILYLVANPKFLFRIPSNIIYLVIYAGLYIGWMILDEPLAIIRKYQQDVALILVQNITLYIIAYNFFLDKTTIRKVILLFGLSCSFVSSLIAFGIGTQSFFEATGIRVATLNTGPNSFGALLGLGCICLVGWMQWPGYKIKLSSLLFLTLAIIVNLYVLIGSGSRGATISTILGISVFAFNREARISKWLLKFLLSTTVILFIFYLIFTSQTTLLRLENTFENEGSNPRLERILPAAFALFQEKWFLGWGPGNNVFELGKIVPLRTYSQFSDTHNDIMHIATEMGVIGLVLVSVFWAKCLQGAIIARKNKMGVMPLALLVCLFATEMTLTFLRTPTLWLFLALSLATGVTSEHSEQHVKRV